MAVLVEAFGDVPTASYAIEQLAVRHAVPERRREHATVRACARTALVRLGRRPEAIPNDADGVPVWPLGVVGSLTHCRGYRAALVSLRTDLASVGVDAEPNRPLPRDVAEMVLRDGDTNDLPTGWHADRIAFCAKEAAYKAWFPATRRWLEFGDVVTNVSADGTFSACADGVPAVHGRWTVHRGWVVAATGTSPC